MSYHMLLVVLPLLALIRFSSSGQPQSLLVGKQETKEKQIIHSFVVYNSFEEGSPLNFKCLHWGEIVIANQSLAYNGEVSWASEPSSHAVHCTCILSFPAELSQELSTTEFDAIDSKHIKRGVYMHSNNGDVICLWRWHLLKGGIYHYDYEGHTERFVKNYSFASNHQPTN